MESVIKIQRWWRGIKYEQSIYDLCNYCEHHCGELQKDNSYMCDECYERNRLMKIHESLKVIKKWIIGVIEKKRARDISSYWVEEQNEDMCVWCNTNKREYKRLCYECDYEYDKMKRERY